MRYIQDLNGRAKINVETIKRSFDALHDRLMARFREKGDHAMISSHEMDSVINEEVIELSEAVRSNDPDEIYSELMDVGVAVMLGIISMHEWHAHPRTYEARNPILVPPSAADRERIKGIMRCVECGTEAQEVKASSQTSAPVLQISYGCGRVEERSSTRLTINEGCQALAQGEHRVENRA